MFELEVFYNELHLVLCSDNRSVGVIIEGFPSTTDEAEFMATKGNYIYTSTIQNSLH